LFRKSLFNFNCARAPSRNTAVKGRKESIMYYQKEFEGESQERKPLTLAFDQIVTISSSKVWSTLKRNS